MQLHDLHDAMLPFVKAIDEICVANGYSQLKTCRQIAQESEFDPNAQSSVGAIGLCQIMPDTAVDWGVDPHNPVASIRALVEHMVAYSQQFGSFELALAAYNAGPGAVAAYNSVPPYPETENYVASIVTDVRAATPYWAEYWKQLLEEAP
jgi:soluble lytic murein transglycosylase-like protein